MRKFIISLISAGTALAVIAVPAFASKDKEKTIVDKVIGISGASGFDTDPGDFDVLREAVVATGLDRKLDGERQLTVFAPTDQAFLDLTGVASESDAFDGVAALGLPAVKRVLKYHIAPERRGAKQIVAAKRVPTLLPGERLTKRRGSAKLTDATGNKVEIVAPNAAKVSNGIVHVIDGVLLPFSP